MRTKAKFSDKQPQLRTIMIDGNLRYFICVNEEEKTEIVDGIDTNSAPSTYWEYDYNEFTDETGTIMVSDVEADPEAYVDYVPNKFPTDSERLSMVESALLEMGVLISDLIGGNHI